MRVAGAFAVIMWHVAGPAWRVSEVKSSEWLILGIYYGVIGSWAVPVFIMMSGALFLNPNKDIPVKKLYTKYIFRIFTAFVFWSFIYAFAGYMRNRDTLKALGHFIEGRYHLWFLYMIAGLYMVVPFMRKIACSEFLTVYFLILSIIFAFTLPPIPDFVSLFSESYGVFSGSVMRQFHMSFFTEYAGYFLLGYALWKKCTPDKPIYILGLSGIVISVIVSALLSRSVMKPVSLSYRPVNVGIMLYSSAIFVFFKKYFNRASIFVMALSKYSFGAYLVHDAVIEALKAIVRICGYDFASFNPVFSVPVLATIVFILSFTISAILNHIPVLNKYIV